MPSRLHVTAGETLEAEIMIGQGPVLSGRLLAPGGAPVAKVTVEAGEPGDFLWRRRWSTLTDPQGRFRFRGIKTGKLQVRAKVEGMGQAQRNVQIGEPLVIRLRPGTVLAGSIPGFATGEVAETITARLAGGSLEIEGTADHETATYRFKNLSPGDWMVTARSGTKQATGRVTIPPQATTARLDLQ